MILQFAWRYFKGKKSTQAIQIISWVSVVAMAVGTAAIIIVLSVFNGFEHFIKNLYSKYYPDIKITAIQGKYFQVSDSLLYEIKSVSGIKAVSLSLEEKVLLSNEENQTIVTLKGIDEKYDAVTDFQNNIKYGAFSLDTNSAISSIALGMGVANRLGVSEAYQFPINCYAFKGDATFSFLPSDIYNFQNFSVDALYVLQEEIDNEFAFTHLSTVQQLAEKYNAVSSIEIKLLDNQKVKNINERLQNILAPYQLKHESRFEQNKTLFFILKSERWAVYAILTLMLIIASFNIVGSLSMLVIEKEKDISILNTMGIQKSGIKKIFIATGIFISVIGASIGCVMAWIICMIQIKFGIIKLGNSGNFLTDSYPVKIQFTDFILVMATVVIIAVIASWIPATKASNNKIELRVR